MTHLNRPLVAVLSGALVLTGLPDHTPAAQATEQSYRAAGGKLTLVGRGHGHGRGMSQYGSYAAATQGKTWRQIVAFYYPGATLQNQARRTIRVSTTGRTGSVARVAIEPGLTATDGAGQTIALPVVDGTTPITSWEVARPSTGGTATTTTLWFRTAAGRKALRSTESGRWTISAADGSLSAQNSRGTTVATYLGRLVGNRSGSIIVPVLVTSLDNYTRQVVPYENIPSWPVQAHAAQAVAARSYGAWHINHPRSSLYDICDTTSCQVMGGITGETTQTRDGIALSAGHVLTANGAALRSEFSSSNGGQPADGGASWTTIAPDPFEPRLLPHQNTWQASIKVADVQKRWPVIGTFTRIVVTNRDGRGEWGGRVTGLRVEGTTGKVTVTVSQLATLTDQKLKSNYFTVVAGPTAISHDLNGDGHGDFASVTATGNVQVNSWTGAGFAPPRTGGAGWGGLRAVMAGQFNSDRYADLLSVDATGSLRLHAARGTNFADPTALASGMGAYDRFTVVPTFSSGKPVVLARRTSDGALVRWTGTGSGGLVSSKPTVVSPTGWPGARVTAMLGVRDLTNDGRSDLVVRTSSGELWVWAGDGVGRLTSARKIGSGWSGFTSIGTVGDINADGRCDIVARTSTGVTRLYRTTATGFVRVDLAAGQGKIAS